MLTHSSRFATHAMMVASGCLYTMYPPPSECVEGDSLSAIPPRLGDIGYNCTISNLGRLRHHASNAAFVCNKC